MSDGYVKLWRKKLDWPWFKDPPVAHLFEYCLLKATWQPRDVAIGGIMTRLGPGQFVFGRKMAAKETGLSEQSIRTALGKLTIDGCVKSTKHSTNLCSIVTVCNWDTYQSAEDASNQQINPPSTNLQPTFNHRQEYKERKERKE